MGNKWMWQRVKGRDVIKDFLLKDKAKDMRLKDEDKDLQKQQGTEDKDEVKDLKLRKRPRI